MPALRRLAVAKAKTCERALGVEARGEAGNDDILS
jgi:hypothetical protein